MSTYDKKLRKYTKNEIEHMFISVKIVDLMNNEEVLTLGLYTILFSLTLSSLTTEAARQERLIQRPPLRDVHALLRNVRRVVSMTAHGEMCMGIYEEDK